MTLRHFAVAIAVATLGARLSASDEGWSIDRFSALLDFDKNGAFVAREAIDVDFGAQIRHGISREIVYQQAADKTHMRQYAITLLAVNDAIQRPLKVDASASGPVQRFRIGDPDAAVSGKQTYRIAYHVIGALNGFADRDELNWNVTGTWPARMASAAIVVRPPDAGSGILNATCFEGPAGSKEPCRSSFTDKAATFTTTHALAPDEQVTVVVSFRKGLFPAPQPLLVNRPRDETGPVGVTTGTIVAIVMVSIAALGVLGVLWPRRGARRS